MNTITQPKRGFAAWTTRDLLVVAVVGLVFGILLVAANYAYLPFIALGPIAQWVWVGVWFIPPFFAGYVFRKPGAALLVSFLANLICVPFTPVGLLKLVGGIAYGLMPEIALAVVTRYREFTWVRLACAGALAGALMFVTFGAMFGVLDFEPGVVVITAIVTVVSSVFGAWLARGVADVIARTGVLGNTALGRERLQEV